MVHADHWGRHAEVAAMMMGMLMVAVASGERIELVRYAKCRVRRALVPRGMIVGA